MPGLRGTQLADIVRGERPALKVLYMSGYVDEQGASGKMLILDGPYLVKPFSPPELTTKVRDVLDAPLTPTPSIPLAS